MALQVVPPAVVEVEVEEEAREDEPGNRGGLMSGLEVG
jgi:hypothetical protein